MTSDHLRRVKRAKNFNPRLVGHVAAIFIRREDLLGDIPAIREAFAKFYGLTSPRFLRRYPYGSQAKGQPRRASGYIA